jgi:hypothetical protein
VGDFLEMVHGIYGGLLYLLCWLALLPFQIAARLLTEGGKSFAKIGALFEDGLHELIDWLGSKLL